MCLCRKSDGCQVGSSYLRGVAAREDKRKVTVASLQRLPLRDSALRALPAL